MKKPDKLEKDRVIGGCYIDGKVICELREFNPELPKDFPVDEEDDEIIE